MTNHIKLTPISLVHVSENYLSWLNDPDVTKYLESNSDYTLDKLIEYVTYMIKNSILMFAIEIIEGDNSIHIGNLKLDPINNQFNSVELGIMIGDKHYWGRGIGKDVMVLAEEYLTKNTKINTITLGVIKNNTRAVNLYLSLGYEIYENIEEKYRMRKFIR
jgi:[ribosomal protein S5]-alanine N-acetyltransferase